MRDAQIQVFVAAFANEHGADEAWSELQQAQLEGSLRIRDAAIIRRDQDGLLRVEDACPRGIRGRIVGRMAAGLRVLLSGRPVSRAAPRGGVGRPFERSQEGALSSSRLRQVCEVVRPGTSTLVALVSKRGSVSRPS
jgi:uncharacterized membrane protein